MSVRESISRGLFKIGRTLKRGSPTILTCVGAVGFVCTVVMAAKATPKAVELIKEDSRKEHDGDPYAYTKMEAVRSAWKNYVPAAVTGVAAITCMFGANALNKRQQASIVSAYALLDKAYKEYRGKVKELLGEDGDKQIREEIAKDKCAEKRAPEEGYLLFCDEYRGECFERTMTQVIQAEYHFNRNFALRGEASLNEFYSFLNLEPIDGGDEIGWDMAFGDEFAGYSWIDFEHETFTMEDGMECCLINYPYPPVHLLATLEDVEEYNRMLEEKALAKIAVPVMKGGVTDE